jgi:hypothetical protein
MKTRVFTALSVLICLVAVTAVALRQRQLATLRSGYIDLTAQLASISSAPLPSTTPASVAAPQEDSPVTPELLRLRNQAAQLTQRKGELSGVQAEHDQLQAQLAARNAKSQTLPPNYIRRTEARWVGLNTPENTLQSFLWALQSRNVTNIARALTPETAKEMLQAAERDPEMLKAIPFPGFLPLKQETQPDGSIHMTVELIPGEALDEPLRLRNIGGEWRLDLR